MTKKKFQELSKSKQLKENKPINTHTKHEIKEDEMEIKNENHTHTRAADLCLLF